MIELMYLFGIFARYKYNPTFDPLIPRQFIWWSGLHLGVPTIISGELLWVKQGEITRTEAVIPSTRASASNSAEVGAAFPVQTRVR